MCMFDTIVTLGYYVGHSYMEFKFEFNAHGYGLGSRPRSMPMVMGLDLACVGAMRVRIASSERYVRLNSARYT